MCVIENRLIVCLVIARVHHQINDFEILFAVTVKLLKEFRHQEAILAARDTDGNFVSVLNQLIGVDRPGETAPDFPSETLDDAALNFLTLPGGCLFFLQKIPHPQADVAIITVLNAIDEVAFLLKILCHLFTIPAGVAQEINVSAVFRKLFPAGEKFLYEDMDGAGIGFLLEILKTPDIDHQLVFRIGDHFLYGSDIGRIHLWLHGIVDGRVPFV